MFEPIGLNFNGSYLHTPEEYQVKELCRIVSDKGCVYAVFATEEIAEECVVFFPDHLGFVCYNGYMNALRIS